LDLCLPRRSPHFSPRPKSIIMGTWLSYRRITFKTKLEIAQLVDDQSPHKRRRSREEITARRLRRRRGSYLPGEEADRA